MTAKPTAIVYVDGFNLYRRKLEHYPAAKWLDLGKLFELLIPTHEIVAVRYFTSEIRAYAGSDPDGPARQKVYLRALSSDPRVSTHFGQFRSDKRPMPIVPFQVDATGRPVTVKVRKIEEKGSDVNLASFMVLDACRAGADLQVLVSNDSDFQTALSIIKTELGREFGLLSPVESPSASLLAMKPLFIKVIREGALLQSQFPYALRLPDGSTVTRPEEWR